MINHEPLDVPITPGSVHLPPKSRFRPRADGGIDDTYRVHFVGRLRPGDMRRIFKTLVDAVDEGLSVGMATLTKVQFVGANMCVFRIWCVDARSARLNKEYEILHRLNAIHEIGDVDGVRYSFLSRARPG